MKFYLLKLASLVALLASCSTHAAKKNCRNHPANPGRADRPGR